MTLQTVFRALAWTSVLAIIIVTDGPIGLRPVTHFSPNLERLVALALVGLLFALAYPSRLLLVFAVLAVAVGIFELAQFVALGRHPRVHDAIVKIVGVTCGVTAGFVINWARARLHDAAYRRSALAVRPRSSLAEKSGVAD